MHENFVEIVYGYESKVDKEYWLSTVAKEVPWILKPETLRSYAWEMMHKENIDDREMDGLDYSYQARWSTMIKEWWLKMDTLNI